MMTSWLRYPIYRLLIPFIAGVVLSRYVTGTVPDPEQSLPVLLLSIILFGWILHKINVFRTRWLFGLVMTALIIMYGFLLGKYENQQKIPAEINLDNRWIFLAHIIELPEEKLKTYKAVAEISGIYSSDTIQHAKIKAVLYFEKDSLSSLIMYDDVILFHTTLERMSGSGNPGEFDFAAYLSVKGLTHQAYLSGDAWKKVESARGFSLKQWSLGMRDYLLDRLRRLNLPEEEFAVAAALVLGTTDYLEGDLTQAFVASGTIHVLCVSGLHIAIVYMLVSSFLGFLRYRKWQIRLRSILALAAVWGYTIVTGSGPSSLRAAAMFTIFQAGIFAGRRNDIFNSFCISAFLLLTIQPSLLWDIGFQLSYFAVAGIITFYKEFAEWWSPRLWLGKKLYELSMLAVSAQLATLPVSIYYFHQFPSYFLPINIFAVPLTTFTLQVAVIYLIVSGINFLVRPFEVVMEYLIRILILAVSWVEDLPGSILIMRHLTFYEALLIFVFIWLVYILIKEKNYKLQISMIIVMILFLVSTIIQRNSVANRRSIVVYNSRDATMVSLVSGTDNFAIIKAKNDSLGEVVRTKYSRHWPILEMHNNVVLNGISDEEFSNDVVFSRDEFIQFYDKKIILLGDSSKVAANHVFKDSLDLLIISGIPRYHDPEEILRNYPADQIVISATCRQWIALKCDTVCRKLDIPCHIVSKSGAYSVSF